ncbi:RNA polymerase recycling motor HelD [Paenibacillus eucommiae]|uniref:DNA helicase-2/ATP-dependent DNA helicase PcrA n=1 Tax=Paenibacillus eucommiae TaxID=1355755 RepID=A0ABS4IQJ0_9BACL|nr:RNA polymerase recycling motor HelD [Paenibacillus eucommiae]MBP1989410.1 DNA helicase-2/ATP-dependent DNA helicase PcrA [Paenibacillus eucommiae]
MSREREEAWLQEQTRVDEVIGLIGQSIAGLEQEVGKVRGEVVSIRKHFWDDVSINLSNSSDLIETYSSMKQQAEVLLEREFRHRHSSVMLSRLTRLIRSPYFGRIDFKEDGARGAEEPERIYLGIASYLHEESGLYLVYDWRAPISSLYYDYSPGTAAYTTPEGKISGVMELKRQFAIQDGSIRLMFDTNLMIGDELLQQVLSRTSDAQMKSIVATIQKEQNRIIRNDDKRMLIVQGAAGSGKTSAALQRVAYLLYKHRKTLRADQLVLFSPNPMFNSYVSTVLPELGEENMQQTTLQEYLEHRLSSQFAVEDPFTQIEYVHGEVHAPGYAARINGIAFKSSLEFLNMIMAYRSLLEREQMRFHSVCFEERVLVSAEQIKEKFYAYDPSIRLVNRMQLLREWLVASLKSFAETAWKEAWVEDEIELLDSDDYQRAFKQLKVKNKKKRETFKDFDKEKELLSKMVIKQRLRPLLDDIQSLNFIDIVSLYKQLFADESLLMQVAGDADALKALPEDYQTICQMTVHRLESSELAYEDATPFLYLQELMQGFQVNTSIRHVIVDEAQDYSPFQLHYLKQLFPRCRMTALGDLNQAIYAHASILSSFDPIVELYGAEETEIIRLQQSYRSTREIVEFTRGMVAGGEAIEPFNRSGSKPQVTIADNESELQKRIIDNIRMLQLEGYASIALICKTAQESRDVHQALKDMLPVHLIASPSQNFVKGIVIIPAYLAKGVEFDAVMIYNGSKQQYSHERERKLFYTACTRAMHHLHIFTLGEPSPFITLQGEETYLLS